MIFFYLFLNSKITVTVFLKQDSKIVFLQNGFNDFLKFAYGHHLDKY